MRRVVVVGGGISGLAAAWELTGRDATSVVVLESAARLGGALSSERFGGRVVDTGPDGFLGRRPEALDLCHELGLGDALVPMAGRGAGVWARGRVRPLPAGLALGIPTRFWPAARSGILGLRGQLALARDALLPRPDVRGPIGDRSIGPLVARKLGRRVADRLVDPLIGGIHAGSIDDMSAAATYPPLLVASQRRGSLMRALRAEVPAPAADAPPLFWSLEGGMASLIEQLRAGLAARGVEIRCDALVTLRVPAESLAGPLVGTGFLVPRRSPAPAGGEPWAVTACTYLSEKWPHLARPGEVLLRASVGRFGDGRADAWSDAEVVERVRAELGLLMGLSGQPLETMVARWPQAFPQYRVHHLMRTAGIEAAMARLGGIAVAGAAYRGVGIPACIASGRAAAQAIT